MENVILYDWLSFTVTEWDLQSIIDVLGLSDVNWLSLNGVKGYGAKLWFESINIHYGGKHEEIWVEMTGSGCRAYESYGRGDWPYLFDFVLHEGNITRLDVAFDDHTGLLDIDHVYHDTYRGEYVSRARAFQLVYSDKGKTVDIGSVHSEVLIRIYDKAKERHCAAGTHWIRVELQLRRDRARAFLELPGDLGDNFASVLLNYLRYVDPDELDSNKWRWPLKDYWSALVGEAAAISLWTAPGVEYNIDRCEDYVFRQAGSAIHTLLSIYGNDIFQDKLKSMRPRNLGDKYKKLIDQHGGVG